MPALVTIALAYFMVMLDATILNVALPRLGDSLRADVAELQWVVDAYVLVFAALLLSGGALSDRLGARRVFALGVGLFTTASVLCGAAPSVGLLIAARALQGVGAALMTPGSLALIGEAFPLPAARARAIAAWAAVAGSAQAIGPVLGGGLVAALGWRGVFLVNLPVGLLVLLGTRRAIAPSRAQPARGLDAPGQLTAIGALALLTLVAIELPSRGVTPGLLVAALAAVALGAACMRIQLRSRTPMLPLALLRIRTVPTLGGAGLLLYFVYFGLLFVLALVFQRAWGASVAASGLLFLPFAGSFSVVAIALSLAPRRPAARPLMVGGLALAALGAAAVGALATGGSHVLLEGALVLIGAGTAFASPAMAGALLDHVPRELGGVASGVFNASRQVGSVLGVALLGGIAAKAHGVALDGALRWAGWASAAALAVSLLLVLRGVGVHEEA
jgi:DHA2 family methylenomycin A resistance protein-like MFS transporter